MSGKCWVLLLGLAALVALSDTAPASVEKRISPLKREIEKRHYLLKRDIEKRYHRLKRQVDSPESEGSDEYDEVTSREVYTGIVGALLDLSEEDLVELSDEELEELAGMLLLLKGLENDAEEAGEDEDRKKK